MVGVSAILYAKPKSSSRNNCLVSFSQCCKAGLNLLMVLSLIVMLLIFSFLFLLLASLFPGSTNWFLLAIATFLNQRGKYQIYSFLLLLILIYCGILYQENLKMYYTCRHWKIKRISSHSVIDLLHVFKEFLGIYHYLHDVSLLSCFLDRSLNPQIQ